MLIYIVQPGDSLDSIADLYHITPDSIAYNNQISPPYPLAVGQALLLSAQTPVLENEYEIVIPSVSEKRTIHAGGYAYPFIDQWILEQTLPYISELFIFSYGFSYEGDLIPPALDDTWMITLAKDYGVAPILTLTPLGPDGNFNNSLISAVVNDLNARTNLKNQIIQQITARGFEGLDIDFEYIKAEDRDAFSDFVAYMQQSVSALGYPVSVALAPKTSATQTGLLYEGKDYAALGSAADYVLLMTYEWGYTYGPPMAVAPINKVREVVDYAVTEIPPEKIHLGIPNYGYDWPLPFIRGTTKAATLGNIQAVSRAVEYGSAIQFDTTAQSPYYHYFSEDIEHEVWFEDSRSMNATFNLLEEYQLRGAGYWNLMSYFRANWLLLHERFTVT